MTLPRGSVTRKMGLKSEILDHSSLAVSSMVALSPVLNASAHLLHGAQQAAHLGQQVGARLQQRRVGLKTVLHLFVQAVPHGLRDVAEHDLPGDGEQHGERDRGGEQDLGEQRQSGKSGPHYFGAPG